jgi:hypothetical protein
MLLLLHFVERVTKTAEAGGSGNRPALSFYNSVTGASVSMGEFADFSLPSAVGGQRMKIVWGRTCKRHPLSILNT